MAKNIEEIVKQFNVIKKETNNVLSDIYSRLEEERKNKKQKVRVDKSQVISRKPKVANIAGKVPELNAVEKTKARSILSSIEDEVRKNPAKYGNLQLEERKDDIGSKGSGEGTGMVTLLQMGRPVWFDLLNKGLGNAFQKVKKREWYDIESLNRGLIKKQKSSGLKPKNYVFLMLDVSGSMSAYSYKGTPLVQLFASYLPPMVMKYDGSFIEVDGHRVVDTNFKTLSKQKLKDKISLSGGGGAEYDLAMNYVNDKIISEKITDPCVIIASDGNEGSIDFDCPKNTLFMTTQYGLDSVGLRNLKKRGFPNADLNQHIIVIEVDKGSVW